MTSFSQSDGLCRTEDLLVVNPCDWCGAAQVAAAPDGPPSVQPWVSIWDSYCTLSVDAKMLMVNLLLMLLGTFYVSTPEADREADNGLRCVASSILLQPKVLLIELYTTAAAAEYLVTDRCSGFRFGAKRLSKYIFPSHISLQTQD